MVRTRHSTKWNLLAISKSMITKSSSANTIFKIVRGCIWGSERTKVFQIIYRRPKRFATLFSIQSPNKCYFKLLTKLNMGVWKEGTENQCHRLDLQRSNDERSALCLCLLSLPTNILLFFTGPAEFQPFTPGISILGIISTAQELIYIHKKSAKMTVKTQNSYDMYWFLLFFEIEVFAKWVHITCENLLLSSGLYLLFSYQL